MRQRERIHKIKYALIPLLGMVFLLWYVRSAGADVVYSDYIRLVHDYLPDVADPGKFLVPDVLTRIPASYLAPNWLTSPWECWSLVTESRMALPTFSCGKRRRMVMKMWVPSRRMIIGQPHTAEDIFSIRVAIEFMEKTLSLQI